MVCSALASPRWPRLVLLITYPVADFPTMMRLVEPGTSSGPDVSRSSSPLSSDAWFAAVNQSSSVRLGLSFKKLSLKFETPSHVPLLVPVYMLPEESTDGPCPDIQRASALP